MISLVATVRAPLADLERFVAYHRNLGVERLQLFFDDPADPAYRSLQAIPGVEATACTPEHWRAAGLTPAAGIEARQVYNAGLALARSRASGDRWLLHLDSDELLHVAGHDLAIWLVRNAGDADAVSFPTWEAFPARVAGHPFEVCRLFKTPARPALMKWAARLGCRQALRYGYFWGHMAGKAAIRVEGPADVARIHGPIRSDGGALRRLEATGAALLHYDGCTFEAWREKWARRRDGSGLALDMRPDRRRQLADFVTANAHGDLDALRREFRRQRMTPPYERAVLRALDLARPVHLPIRLFTTPKRR